MLRFYFFIALTILPSSRADDQQLGSVILAHVLFRHGDRTPVDPYPNDPWRNESLWPVPFGQLTNLGKHQHLELGRWFRARYDHMLPRKYSPYDIYVRSTDMDRTLMSAEANLAGLYPPVADQVWDELKWMPIPVHTVPEKLDNVVSGKKYCARYNYEYNRVLNSPEIQGIVQKNQELFDYLTRMAGKRIADLEQLNFLYNTLFIEGLYNKSLPVWTKSVYPDKLEPLAALSFTTMAYNKILQRLRMGLLMKEVVNHMSEKSKNALVPDRKLFVYSAHDDTVANLLMTLGLFQPHCPPYTATILIELRLNSKRQHIVTISYKNSSEPILLTLPGCIPACPLSQFIKLTKDVIPEDWDKECTINWDTYGVDFSISTILGIMTFAILLLIFVVLLIISFVFWHYKRVHNQYYTPLSTDPI
ncbi:prostatic acid phosphatase-like [Fopius arisanus]|uniref:acid phosphatase n=1 Tax=Fopius arisanus TaxID=64838 RepID=A0A9R1TK59_9HYME|nr:PREDICTED: prostatic acid phosphatase-like [Fopius arisanus]